MRKKKSNVVRIKGFLHGQIVDKATGKVVADSGVMQNQITNYGLRFCLLAAAAGGTGSVQVAGARLGSGSAPASDATVLPGSHSDYYSTVGLAVNGSTQARYTQTYDGTLGEVTLANAGLLAASGGSLIAGNTMASSVLGTNQEFHLTYDLNFGTS
ncbi:MAG: hypothetical protein RBT66_07075 [bacterium]|nr:hypothetical protein [bacterium]